MEVKKQKTQKKIVAKFDYESLITNSAVKNAKVLMF